jgi:hypothetical protein
VFYLLIEVLQGNRAELFCEECVIKSCRNIAKGRLSVKPKQVIGRCKTELRRPDSCLYLSPCKDRLREGQLQVPALQPIISIDWRQR